MISVAKMVATGSLAVPADKSRVIAAGHGSDQIRGHAGKTFKASVATAQQTGEWREHVPPHRPRSSYYRSALT